MVASLEEHLQQRRERLTVTEQEVEARVQAFSLTAPVAKHYLEAGA